MEENIDISICVITYNHESFVSRAFESINCQNFSGTIEVIIGVDLSSDKTAELVQELNAISRFPTQLIINTERRGMFGNLRDVLSLAKGKYIAMLEGDDFWYDPLKLEKQFNYLEGHANCVATGGGILALTDKIKSTKKWNNKRDQYYYADDLIHANRLSFCTVMFRKSAFQMSKYDLLQDSPHLDWPIYLSLFDDKKENYIKVFADVFSVYRIHQGGVFSGVDAEKRKNNVLKTMQYVLLMAKEPIAESYVQATVKYQTNRAAACPTPKQLCREFGMPKTSVPSFYLYNFRKRQIVGALLKNPVFLFQLFGMMKRKFARRYRTPQ